ncbi:unnamed protein product [Schistosoma haematobium]|nr:unnamed protein product [Schistosoma haematobium]
MPNCSFQDARTACINYEALNELDIQSMKISNNLLSRHDELQFQGQSNLRSFNSDSYSRVNMIGVSTRDYKANHKEFHCRNSCAFRNAKCIKCGKIGHIQSVCKATVHFVSSSTKSCNLNLNNSDVSSDHLSLSTISNGNAHIQKRLYTSLGSFPDFIVDTGSIESIISFKNLKSLDPNVVVRSTEVSILGITGHRLLIRGCCELLIRDDNSSYIPCEFLVSETGLSILGLKNLKRLKVELSFLVSKENSDTLLKDLIATCAKCSGDQSSSILTTINTPFGLFKYNFLPFGLSCSPAICQEVMNKVVSDLEGVEVYQDDLIVHGSNKVVHDQRLIALLRRLIEKNITVNPNKCSFCVSSF